jgi:hypothetical protein
MVTREAWEGIISHVEHLAQANLTLQAHLLTEQNAELACCPILLPK